jgi:hypothetical protein
MPYSEDEETEETTEEESEDEESDEEESEDEESEDEESEEEESEGGGGLLGGLSGMLGGAGLGGIAGGLVEQVTDQLKSGKGLNIGEIIDDATEDKGGIVKSVGDMVGGFLNRDKKDSDDEDE